MRPWFEGKCAVVTGASDGIGRALVKRLVQEHGCCVIGTGRSESKFASLTDELRDGAERFSCKLFDVAQEREWESFRDLLEAGGLFPTLVISNAGILPPIGPAMDFGIDEWYRTMDVNFMAGVYAARAMLPLLLRSESPGLVYTVSAAALMPLPGMAAYSAAKAALLATTDCLREELRGRVYVGAVCPGCVKTGILRDMEVSFDDPRLHGFGGSTERVANRILRGIAARKPLILPGGDARVMAGGKKLLPTGAQHAVAKVMAKYGGEVFDGIFTSGRNE